MFSNLKIPANKIGETCLKAKQARKKLNKTKIRTRSNISFENVHPDVDELPIRSFDGEKYFVTFIDEASHFTTVFNLKNRSEVLKYYKFYENRMTSMCFRQNIINLYCDNGGEYVSKEFEEYTTSKGTVLYKIIRNRVL